MENHFHSININQIPVHFISTPKYKTNFIAIYIRQPLTEKHHTQVSLLSSLLRRATAEYPTAQSLERALNDMYGATLTSDVFKRGEDQVIAIRLQLANEKFLKDQTPLFERGIKLLSHLLTRPRLENGTFYQHYVELEKDLLTRKLAQIKDDKIRYAAKRCVEEMYTNERFRLHPLGSAEDVPDLTADSLYDLYQRMISSHPIDMFVVGDVSVDKISEMINTHFRLPREKEIEFPSTDYPASIREVKEVFERTEISQGKLHIGYRTNTVYADDDYIPLIVFNGLFGGFSHSKLFRHVREKESLAYYISSSIESHKGFMMIMSGIDFTHYERTVEIIKDQLEQVKQGQITDNELNQTKAMLINQIREANDQPFQLIDRFYHGIVGSRKRHGEQLLEEIAAVDIEQITRVADKIELDTIYFLTSQEGVTSDERQNITV